VFFFLPSFLLLPLSPIPFFIASGIPPNFFW
jgi:hypothetical protein